MLKKIYVTPLDMTRPLAQSTAAFFSQWHGLGGLTLDLTATWPNPLKAHCFFGRHSQGKAFLPKPMYRACIFNYLFHTCSRRALTTHGPGSREAHLC